MYTEDQGSEWIPFEPADPPKKLYFDLQKRGMWGEYEQTERTFYRRDSKKYTQLFIKTPNGPSLIKAHSVLFPDGWMWDSSIRSYRRSELGAHKNQYSKGQVRKRKKK